ITGAGTKAVRAKGVEAGLVGKKLDAATIEAAAAKAADGVDVQADLQGSVEYKSHLCRVFAKRAITEAGQSSAPEPHGRRGARSTGGAVMRVLCDPDMA